MLLLLQFVDLLHFEKRLLLVLGIPKQFGYLFNRQLGLYGLFQALNKLLVLTEKHLRQFLLDLVLNSLLLRRLVLLLLYFRNIRILKGENLLSWKYRNVLVEVLKSFDGYVSDSLQC